MGHCDLCGAEQQFPFECSYCGGTFCSEHRLPENHLCPVARNGFKRNQSAEEPQGQSRSVFWEELQFRKPVNVPRKRSHRKILIAAFALILIIGAASALLLINSISNGLTSAYNSNYDSGLQTQTSDGNPTYTQGFNDGYQKGLQDGVGTGYQFRDPSYQEMLDFLASDKTNYHMYADREYTCYDYARDVCNHASDAGFRCGFVYLETEDSGHALVCFNTTDCGLVFIEPQTDERVKLTARIGNTALYETSDSNMTIVKYGIIW
jgi:hypothetical protein